VDGYIVVVGSTGRVGRRYCTHLRYYTPKFIGISRTESITGFPNIKIDFNSPDTKNLKEFISKNKIEAIIHLATTNTLMNDSLEYHKKINVGSVKLFLDLIKEYNLECPFIYTSTELVFDSKKIGQDEDSQDFKPLSNYAKSKLMAEKQVLKYENSFVVRFGNVIGIENDFLTSALNNLKEKKTYNAWDNVYNRFTYLDDISYALDKIAHYKGKEKIFHVACNDPPLSRYEFLRKVIKNKYESTDLLKYLNKISATREQLSIRPQYAVLNTKITEKELNLQPKSIFDCLSKQ
jgi:dTDP-4-dehydrorhamnose reductase